MIKYLISLLYLYSICFCFNSCKKQVSQEKLNEFNGRVLKVTPQILQVRNNVGKVIMFDNRKVTYVSGILMPNDSVCVSYIGKLDNGTESIIAELIPIFK